jgi:hypothetical protein
MHEDDLAPGKTLRDRVESSRSERMGSNTAVGGPVTSPPVDVDDEPPASPEVTKPVRPDVA